MSYPASTLLPLGSEVGSGLGMRQVASREERMLQAALLPVGDPERRAILVSLLRRDLDPPEESLSEPLGVTETYQLLLSTQGTMRALLADLRTLEQASTVPGVEIMVRVMVMTITGFERELAGFRETVFEPDG